MSDSSELKEVQDWVSARARLLVNNAQDREEIVASVLSDYWKYRQKNVTRNHSGSKDIEYGLANQILRWRIADHYRARVSTFRSGYGSEQVDPETLANAEASPFQSALHQEVLEEITRLMTHMPARDRALLLRDVATDAPEIALTASERQQLSRARTKLIQRIETRYGESLSQLNQQEEWDNDAPN